MEIKDFIGRYTSRFGDFPADLNNPEEMREWKEIITCLPENKAHSAFEMVGELLGKSARKPLIREFSPIVARLNDRPVVSSGRPNACVRCNYTGYLRHVISKPHGKWRIGFFKGSRPYWVVMPCTCALGRKMQEYYQPEIKLQTRGKVEEWICAQEQNAVYSELSYDYYMHLEFVKYCKLAPKSLTVAKAAREKQEEQERREAAALKQEEVKKLVPATMTLAQMMGG